MNLLFILYLVLLVGGGEIGRRAVLFRRCHNVYDVEVRILPLQLLGRMVELVYTRDLKSLALRDCGFESRFGYHNEINYA